MSFQATRVQQGDSIDYTPGSAVAAGAVVATGTGTAIAPSAIAANTLGSLQKTGVFDVVKATGAIAIDQPVFWNAAGDPVGGTAGSGAATTTAKGMKFLGIAVAAAASGDATVRVRKVDGLAIRYGQHTTVAASDTVVTGLAVVVSVVACYDTDPADANFLVSASIGDQAGSPAAGSVLIKTWQNTSGTDPTPTAAGSFSKKVNWIAVGY